MWQEQSPYQIAMFNFLLNCIWKLQSLSSSKPYPCDQNILHIKLQRTIFCSISIEATEYVFYLSLTHYQIYPPGNEEI